MIDWLLKRTLSQTKPTLVFFVGDWGKSMGLAATASVLRAAKGDIDVLESVHDVSKALVTLGRSSLIPAMVSRFLKAKQYPSILCIEARKDATWPSAEVLAQAGQVILVIPSLSAEEASHLGSYVKGVLRLFEKDSETLTVIYNADLPKSSDAFADCKQQVTFGINQLADFRAMNIETISHPEAGEESDGRWRGMSCKVQAFGSTVPMQLFGGIGRPHVSAGLCALAIGHTLGVNVVEALQALRAHSPLPGRMSLIPGIKKSMLIDDTYDTDPETIGLALQEVAALPLVQGKKRIAVIGEMSDTGAQSAAVHCSLGEMVASLKFDLVVGVGERTTDLLACANRAGVDQSKLVHFNDKIEAGKFVQHALRKGELVLIKGSAKDKLESVVKELMAFPLKAKQDLLQR
jgi:UDP-N-acetylmuramoyl-tripeptide--D-alanyl-D-alanine ligase